MGFPSEAALGSGESVSSMGAPSEAALGSGDYSAESTAGGAEAKGSRLQRSLRRRETLRQLSRGAYDA